MEDLLNIQNGGPVLTSMTMRDYFAAQAMNALLPDKELMGFFIFKAGQESGRTPEQTFSQPEIVEQLSKNIHRSLARLSYVVADAMLEIRNRNEL